ncbi:hypothetical protein BDN70DRAFT_883695, partial [Pholiota conissans]
MLQAEFKDMWKRSPVRETSLSGTDTAPVPRSDEPPASKKLRKIVKNALTETLRRTISRYSLAGNLGHPIKEDATSSVAESESSGEGRGPASDIEGDFYEFEGRIAENIVDEDPEANAAGPSTITRGDISRPNPPRGSSEWSRKHRVQLSTVSGHFRLIHGRGEMAARRESYQTGDDISPVHSVCEYNL